MAGFDSKSTIEMPIKWCGIKNDDVIPALGKFKQGEKNEVLSNIRTDLYIQMFKMYSVYLHTDNMKILNY